MFISTFQNVDEESSQMKVEIRINVINNTPEKADNPEKSTRFVRANFPAWLRVKWL